MLGLHGKMGNEGNGDTVLAHPILAFSHYKSCPCTFLRQPFTYLQCMHTSIGKECSHLLTLSSVLFPLSFPPHSSLTFYLFSCCPSISLAFPLVCPCPTITVYFLPGYAHTLQKCLQDVFRDQFQNYYYKLVWEYWLGKPVRCLQWQQK